MTELQQRRWFTKKSIKLRRVRDIVVAERSPFKSRTREFGLVDLHPFYEHFQNNALGYLFACGLCLLLTLSSAALAWTLQSLSVCILSGAFFACSTVVFVLYAVHRIDRYEFFHRGTGKTAFSVWQTRSNAQEVRQFVKQLTHSIQWSIDHRFEDARNVLNPRMRHGASEEAIYTLYRIGVLDFTEMETLLINAERKYHGSKTDSKSPFAGLKNNVIDFEKYRQETKRETNA